VSEVSRFVGAGRKEGEKAPSPACHATDHATAAIPPHRVLFYVIVEMS